jgi:D-serine deaminase-like pyridoxal phosphate-dependent protein
VLILCGFGVLKPPYLNGDNFYVKTTSRSVRFPTKCRGRDAGLKSLSVDSGLPTIVEHPDLDYIKCSDEHGVISDPNNRLRINDRLLLIPGHCDPTVNLFDRLVAFRGIRIERVWPVTARGKLM